MKHLVNYCPIDFYEKDLQGKDLGQMLKLAGFDGIEQFVYEENVNNPLYVEETVGVHLKYWPYWLDFYLNKKSYFTDFASNGNLRDLYWGCTEPQSWQEKIKNHLATVAKYKPEYLVWHVAQADDEEIFTYRFKYKNREVLKYTAELVNNTTADLAANCLLLFENLWWPGLNLLNPRDVDYFFSRINHNHKGIMLDTGHLMNTNPYIKSQEEGILYIKDKVEALGTMGSLIKGLHLNASLAGEYLRTFPRIVPGGLNNVKIWQHITAIDQHQIFTTPQVKDLVEFIQPQYITHELSYDNVEDMLYKAGQQLKLIK